MDVRPNQICISLSSTFSSHFWWIPLVERPPQPCSQHVTFREYLTIVNHACLLLSSRLGSSTHNHTSAETTFAEKPFSPTTFISRGPTPYSGGIRTRRTNDVGKPQTYHNLAVAGSFEELWWFEKTLTGRLSWQLHLGWKLIVSVYMATIVLLLLVAWSRLEPDFFLFHLDEIPSCFDVDCLLNKPPFWPPWKLYKFPEPKRQQPTSETDRIVLFVETPNTSK